MAMDKENTEEALPEEKYFITLHDAAGNQTWPPLEEAEELGIDVSDDSVSIEQFKEMLDNGDLVSEEA